MAEPTENLRAIRRQVAAVAPDNLTRLDLLGLRASLLQALKLSEILLTIIHHERQSKIMSTTATLEKPISIDEALQGFAVEGESVYCKLVEDFVETGKVDPADLRHALAASGRTMEEFGRHVKDMQGRRLALETIARGNEGDDPVLAELQQVKLDALAAIDAELERHKAEMEKLIAARQAANESHSTHAFAFREAVGRAHAHLHKTTAPEVKAEHSRLSTATVRIANRIHPARETVRDLSHRVEFIAAQGSPRERAELPELREKLEKLQVELDELTKAHAQAKADLDRFEPVLTDWRRMDFGSGMGGA